MRPQTLRLSAFGAYAAEQVVDLAELGPHRLFLIHGPTGSGKTTLLDAICFALFGESSGDERKAGDLRSHHADAATPTFVELDFAIGPDRYRIKRTPAQQRPGRSGRLVNQRPEVTLWKRSSGDDLLVLAEQERPVRDRIAELLGYTADEFRQVVLLPQGRFRELLTASPDARQQILATLFRTAFYRRIEEGLKTMERGARGAAEAAEVHRRTLLGEALAETPEAAADAVEALRQEAEAAKAQADAAALAATAADQALAAALREAALLKAASDAAQRLTALAGEQPIAQAKQARVEAARRAERLAGEDATASAVAEVATRAASDRLAADEGLRQAEHRVGLAREALADAEERDRAAQTAADEGARLEALIAQAAALAESGREAAEAQRTLATAMEEHQRRVAARDASVQALAAATAAHQAAATLAERRAERQAALVRAKARAADVAEHAKAMRAATVAERDFAVAQATANATSEGLAEARTARAEAERIAWANAAARLAATLAEGEPCPVCGSQHHPSPADTAAHAGADIDAARAAEAAHDTEDRAAREALVRAEGALKAAIERREDLEARVTGASSDTPPEVELKDAEAALAAAEAAAKGLADVAQRLQQAGLAQCNAEAALVEQVQTLAEAQRAATGAEAAHQARLDAVPFEAREPTALKLAIERAKATAQALRTALDRDREEQAAAGAALAAAQQAAQHAAGRAATAATQAAQAEAALLLACHAQGFADLAAYRAARRPTEEIERIAAEVKTFDEGLAAAREVHRQALAAAEGIEPPDLPAREAEAKSRAAGTKEALGREGAVRERAQEAAERLERIRAADLAFAQARERHAVVQNLARQVGGQNPLRLSFEGFVLASLLDEALSAANDHLRLMLGGRYLLRRREEPGRANAAIGLDIEVLDEWTGQARASGTLSGGEGFCAALAMALGLAETVQAHAGARPVDALLIDEGFGSLDEEALDKAMEVLASLPGGNRIVGIISHVGELKTRIPARLEVAPGVRGSTARFVVS